MISRRLMAGGLAVLGLALASSAALAAPGRATTTVNVRSGPGTNYGVVDTLRPGEPVDIVRCTSGWCYVGKPGSDGWVSSAYLERAGGPIYAPPPVVVRPPIVVHPPMHRPPMHRPPMGPPPAHRPPPHKPPMKPKPPICKTQPTLPICNVK